MKGLSTDVIEGRKKRKVSDAKILIAVGDVFVAFRVHGIIPVQPEGRCKTRPLPLIKITFPDRPEWHFSVTLPTFASNRFAKISGMHDSA